jgi:membrane protease YdiL (CAAX protease family)
VEDMEELDSSIVLLMARRKIEYIAICTIILLASLSNIAIIIFNHLTYFRCAYWTWPVFLGCAGLVILILYVFDERIIRRQYKHFQS